MSEDLKDLERDIDIILDDLENNNSSTDKNMAIEEIIDEVNELLDLKKTDWKENNIRGYSR